MISNSYDYITILRLVMDDLVLKVDTTTDDLTLKKLIALDFYIHGIFSVRQYF